MALESTNSIAIVGTGLLGASIGLALKAAGYRGRIIGVGRRQETLDKAMKRGAIDSTVTDILTAAESADLIILATPVETVIHQIKQLATIKLDGKVITDVGSTKKTIVDVAQSVLPNPDIFIGSHPMAGSSAHGPDAASADLFQSKLVITTPTSTTDANALQLVNALWETIGMRITQMHPDNHDRVVARVSHLPHAMAVILVQLVMGQPELNAASTGFGDTTRVASGDPTIWADIFLDNKKELIAAIDDFQLLVNELRAAVEGNERDDLITLLQQVQTARMDWQSKQNNS